MFTIKLYADNGARQRIYEADDFTIIRTGDGDQTGDGWTEVTAHRKTSYDVRFDIGSSPYTPEGGVWQKAIIENAAGKTTEIIGEHPPRSLRAA